MGSNAYMHTIALTFPPVPSPRAVYIVRVKTTSYELLDSLKSPPWILVECIYQ